MKTIGQYRKQVHKITQMNPALALAIQCGDAPNGFRLTELRQIGYWHYRAVCHRIEGIYLGCLYDWVRADGTKVAHLPFESWLSWKVFLEAARLTGWTEDIEKHEGPKIVATEKIGHYQWRITTDRAEAYTGCLFDWRYALSEVQLVDKTLQFQFSFHILNWLCCYKEFTYKMEAVKCF